MNLVSSVIGPSVERPKQTINMYLYSMNVLNYRHSTREVDQASLYDNEPVSLFCSVEEIEELECSEI